MMLLVVSAVLASLALGVTLAFWLCSALFMLFRMNTRAKRSIAITMQTKTVQL